MMASETSSAPGGALETGDFANVGRAAWWQRGFFASQTAYVAAALIAAGMLAQCRRETARRARSRETNSRQKAENDARHHGDDQRKTHRRGSDANRVEPGNPARRR